VTFLILPPLEWRAPTREADGESRIRVHCGIRGLSCASLRVGYPNLVARGVSPFGFDNGRFNSGHLNEEGHRLAADLLAAELERVLADELR
jgi:hypothetical protein